MAFFATPLMNRAGWQASFYIYGGVGLAWCGAGAIVGDDGPAAALAGSNGKGCWPARRRLCACRLGRAEGKRLLAGLAAERPARHRAPGAEASFGGKQRQLKIGPGATERERERCRLWPRP